MKSRNEKLRQHLLVRLPLSRAWFVKMTRVLLLAVVVVGMLYLHCVQSSFWIGTVTVVSATLVMLFLLWSSYIFALAVLMLLPPPIRDINPQLLEHCVNESANPLPYPVPLTPPRYRLALREVY